MKIKKENSLFGILTWKPKWNMDRPQLKREGRNIWKVLNQQKQVKQIEIFRNVLDIHLCQ
jgi:hypothetical protein